MMREVAAGCCLLVLTLSPACASLRSVENSESRPLWATRPSGSLSVAYARRALIPARVAGEQYERGQPEIDPRSRRVFVGSSDRGLYAFRAEDGAHIWRFETLGFVQCQPLYDPVEDVVYFGSNDGALYRVRARDGALDWRFMTNAEVAKRPVLSDGMLYVANANDTIIAIEAKTGRLIWHQHRTPALGMEVAGYSGPTLFRDKIYAGFSDGNVIAFDAKSGAERWQPVDLAAEAEQTLGQLPEQLDVDTTPVPDTLEQGAVVYVASYAGGVFALDAETGTQVWSNPGVFGVTELTLWSEPARETTPSGDTSEIGLEVFPSTELLLGRARKVLIASSGTTGLWGLDPESGKELWRHGIPAGGISGTVPFVGALLVSASQLGVFLVSPLGGELIDGLHIAEGVSAAPAVLGNRAFVLTNGGQFLALHVTPPGTYASREKTWF